MITLQFNSLGLDVAEQRQGHSNPYHAPGSVPSSDLPIPPIYSKTNPADTPLIYAGHFQDEALSSIWPTPAWLPKSATARRRSVRHSQRRAKTGRSHPADPPPWSMAQPGRTRSAIVAGNVNRRRPAPGLPQWRQLMSCSCRATTGPSSAAHQPRRSLLMCIDDVENAARGRLDERGAVISRTSSRQPGADIIGGGAGDPSRRSPCATDQHALPKSI